MRMLAKSLEIAGRYPHMAVWLAENCPAIVDQVRVLSIFLF